MTWGRRAGFACASLTGPPLRLKHANDFSGPLSSASPIRACFHNYQGIFRQARGVSLKQITVVGAVIVRDGQILCARRGPEGTLGGMWEFPGGKIESGEKARDALVREIREELGCEIKVGTEVTTTTHAYDFGVVTLTTFWSELVASEPELTEHSEVRWLPASRLDELAWAPADLPAVEIIRNA